MLSILLLFATVGCLAAAFVLGRARRAVQVVLGVGFVILAAAWVFFTGVYDISKFVGVCLMPAGLLWLALFGLGWRLSKTGRTRLAVAAWGLWLGYSLAGNVVVGKALVGWLERDFSRIDPLKLSPFDAVLVLGGGLEQHDHGQLCLGDSGDRVVLAARLYHAGKTGFLITSGPFLTQEEEKDRVSVPVLTAQMWQELGVAREHVLLLEGPRTTSEEIAAAEALFREHSWQRVGLLTSAYHLRRALRLCQRRGIEVTPLPANFLATTGRRRPKLLVPQAGGFSTIHRACWEILGAAVGR